MRNTEHLKRHMSVASYVDGEKVGEVEVEDPFHNTTIRIVSNFWQRVLNLFHSEMVVRVHVRADGVAIARWFMCADICEKCKVAPIGPPHDGSSASDPGYHHGDERWCENCYYGRVAESVPNHAENSSN